MTGGAGFIGTHLVKRLLEDSSIHLVLLSKSEVEERYAGVTYVVAPPGKLSSETWRKAGLERIDFVFHLGAFTPKTQEQGDFIEAIYRDNLLGTRELLASLPAPPVRVVFSSTLDVYAQLPDDTVLTEASPVGPSNLYGASKLFCEQLIRTYARSQNCGHAILRYGHIFGPGEGAYGKLIPQTIKHMLSGKAPVIYGDGSTERDFLYVTDAIEATVRAAMSDAPELGPVNIVRGASVSIRTIVEILISILNYSEEIQYVSGGSMRSSLRFDNSQMRKDLGHWDLVPFEDGLKEEVRYFQSCINE